MMTLLGAVPTASSRHQRHPIPPPPPPPPSWSLYQCVLISVARSLQVLWGIGRSIGDYRAGNPLRLPRQPGSMASDFLRPRWWPFRTADQNVTLNVIAGQATCKTGIPQRDQLPSAAANPYIIQSSPIRHSIWAPRKRHHPTQLWCPPCLLFGYDLHHVNA